MAAKRLNIGAVLLDSFRRLAADWPTFLALALVSALAVAGVDLLQKRLQLPGMVDVVPLIIMGVGAFFLLLLSYGAQNAILVFTINSARGIRMTAGQAIGQGLLLFIPLILVRFMAYAAIFTGLLFLIVPGIFIALALIIAEPAYVAERGNIFTALYRSWQLTRGARGRILLLLLLYLGLVITVGSATAMLPAAIELPLRSLGLGPFLVYFAIMISTLYLHLRKLHDRDLMDNAVRR